MVKNSIPKRFKRDFTTELGMILNEGFREPHMGKGRRETARLPPEKLIHQGF